MMMKGLSIIISLTAEVEVSVLVNNIPMQPSIAIGLIPLSRIRDVCTTTDAPAIMVVSVQRSPIEFSRVIHYRTTPAQ